MTAFFSNVITLLRFGRCEIPKVKLVRGVCAQNSISIAPPPRHCCSVSFQQSSYDYVAFLGEFPSKNETITR